MSLFAVATEALVITTAFSRSWLYRLSIGLAAVGLQAGFWVFMGHFWPGWWILFLGFLPWQLLPRVHRSTARLTGDGAPAPARWPVTAAQMAIIALVIGQQVVFSTLRIERAPMFSYYPMYSGWYAGPADYEASRPLKYRLVASTDRGDIELRCKPYEKFIRTFQEALNGSPQAKASVWQTLGACIRDVGPVRAALLEGDRLSFDFNSLEFTSTRAAVVLGPLPAGDGAASTAH
jgi:hypothetical protein